MRRHKTYCALIATLLLAPAAVMAQDAPAAASEEAESPLTWTVAATSDYVFRGLSQTSRDPALQAGLTYSADNGFYVGGWASNVDFGAGSPDVELDTFVGFNKDLSDTVNADIMVTRYNYLGGSGNIDYNELIGKLTFNEMVYVTAGYSNDYGNGGENGTYVGIGGNWELGHEIGLDVQAGRSNFGDSFISDYTDWSLGLSRQFGPANVAVRYHDTNLSGRASDSVVLTVTFGN